MLGLVTIGQAPREDVVRSMFGNAPLRLAQAGALDAVTDTEITRLRPANHEHVLVTRLADGREVTVAKERLLPLLAEAVARVEAAGATVVCVLCTGEFPTLVTRTRLVFPDRLLAGTVDAVAPTGALGVLMPHAAQHASMERKWSRVGRRVVTASASPYAEGAVFGEATRALVAGGVSFIVMDCMGFDRAMQACVRSHCDMPVVLANALVGAVLREIGASGGFALEQPEGVETLHCHGC